MSDYPEYLNPFFEDEKSELAHERKKRSGSFSNTLKGFTSTLRKSFRHKSKSQKPDQYYDVEIRRSTLRPPPARPATYSSPPRDTQTYSPAFPRSRFRERLAKSQYPVLTEQELDKANPFKEDDVVADEVKTIERPKRRKKRAPPPPGASNDSNHLQVPNSSSKWSLTSAETDTSYSTYAPSECSELEDMPEPQEESAEVKQIIQEFNRDMKKLTDDTNNNVIVVDEEVGKTDEEEVIEDIPTVSVSCAETEDQKEEVTEISRVAAIVRQLEGTTDDEKCRRLSKSEEVISNGYLEDDDGSVKKPAGVAALAEPEDTDLDTPPQACSTPVPKVRKNKLAKCEMLGYDDE